MLVKENLKLNSTSFMPISALVLIQLKLKELSLVSLAKPSFQVFTSRIKEMLVLAFGIDEHDEEWLEEMIIGDVVALENLQSRMEAKLPFLANREEGSAQHLLSHLLVILLCGSSSSSDLKSVVGYDSRLRCALKNLASSLYRTNTKSIPFIMSLVENDYLFKMASDGSQIDRDRDRRSYHDRDGSKFDDRSSRYDDRRRGGNERSDRRHDDRER